ncbi:MAG TPA: DUF3014 domain-containing protein [Caldimonas sp.]|nr:DUF3014 domain-containing protein [Caldimonas sp.]
MKRQHQVLVAVVIAVVAIAVIVWFGWLRHHEEGESAAVAPVETPAASAPIETPAPPEPASAPASAVIQHPIGAVDSEEATPDAATMLADVFGKRVAESLFVPDDFAHRLAATVDGLGRVTASSRLWPAQPTPGHFSVAETNDGATVVAADNAERYAAFIGIFERVDPIRVAQAYKRFYPQLQKAYQDLGYPDGYFNDRLVDVIDSMLAAPEPVGPVEVRLPNVEGASAPARPWLVYEFADPALASLPAGQKLLVRMGVANERRVKALLLIFRGLVAPGPAAAR